MEGYGVKKVRLIKKRIFGKGHQMTFVLQPHRERGRRERESEGGGEGEGEGEGENKRGGVERKLSEM